VNFDYIRVSCVSRLLERFVSNWGTATHQSKLFHHFPIFARTSDAMQILYYATLLYLPEMSLYIRVVCAVFWALVRQSG